MDTGNKVLAGLIIFPALIVSICSFITHFAYYTNFLLEGTYVIQIENIKRDKFDDIFSTMNLVEGRSIVFFTSIIRITMVGMTLLSIICLVVGHFKYESRKMKWLIGVEVALIVLSSFAIINFIQEEIQGV